MCYSSIQHFNLQQFISFAAESPGARDEGGRDSAYYKAEKQKYTSQCSEHAESRGGDSAKKLNENLEFFLPPYVKKLQEGVHNSLKHSWGFRLKISVTWNSVLEIEIEDNGQAYLGQTRVQGLGLTSMQERAKAIGAKLDCRPGFYCVVVKITMPNPNSK